MRNITKIIALGLLLVPFAINASSRSKPDLSFVAHNGARGTSDQNKRYIVPRILASRSSRTIGDLGDIIQGQNWFEDDWIFEDIECYANWLWASNLHKNPDLGERPGKVIWKNVSVTTQPDPYYASMKWGTREYNAPQREFIDCDFYAIPKEHGAYVSNYEGTLVDNCTFVRMGSQGVQFAHRPMDYQQYGPDTRAYSEKPLHILRDSHFIDCAQGGTRPSYNASYFNPGSPTFPGTLLIENCSFVCKWLEPRYDGFQSTGALVVTPMQGNEVLDANFMEVVCVKNCLFDFTDPDRSMINIRSTDTVIFEDCCFIVRDTLRGKVDIDSPTEYLGDSKTQRIILRNCIALGGTKLRVFKRGASSWNDFIEHDLNTYGKEVIINGETGEVISSGAYN